MTILENFENNLEFKFIAEKLAGIEDEGAWDNEGGLVTQEIVDKYAERLKYMEENGI